MGPWSFLHFHTRMITKDATVLHYHMKHMYISDNIYIYIYVCVCDFVCFCFSPHVCIFCAFAQGFSEKVQLVCIKVIISYMSKWCWTSKYLKAHFRHTCRRKYSKTNVFCSFCISEGWGSFEVSNFLSFALSFLTT